MSTTATHWELTATLPDGRTLTVQGSAYDDQVGPVLEAVKAMVWGLRYHTFPVEATVTRPGAEEPL